MKKRTSAALVAAGAISGLVGLGYYWLFRRPLPRQKGQLQAGNLGAPVEILRDRWGVPHIYGKRLEDILFAQGYVHAEERLWQMDFNRRMAAGRLSEILGQVSVPLDRWMRILGLRRVAKEESDLLDPQTRQLLEAYAAGLNARIAQGRLPLEFTLLRYQPEPWTVVDTLSWKKMMAWNLSVNWETEILRARLIDRLGAEKAAELELIDAGASPRVVPPGVDYSCIGEQALRQAEQARRFSGPRAQDGLGSNNWVVAPSRTESGMPLLANDMHLLLSIPAIWYENHLVGDGLNVTGVSFPGVPGVIVGHNEHVAWGFTNGFPDVQDLYIERLRRTPEGGVQYLYDEEWQDARVIREEIKVKGGQPVVEEVVITRHGPIINGLAPDLCGEEPLALRWTALEPDEMLRAMLAMNTAKSCLEFRDSLRYWAVPIQNMVYADRQGNIGYSFPGRVPIRRKGDGRTPVPGWNSEWEWEGFIPFEELPHLYNPPQGYIVTANNRVVGEDYPHFLGYDHVTASRARRITELIDQRSKIDVDWIRRMQMDQVSTNARDLVTALDFLNPSDPELRRVLKRLRAWDGHLAADSPEASIYEALQQHLIRRLLAEPLGDLAERYAGKGPVPVLQEHSLFGERAREWLLNVIRTPDSQWCRLDGYHTREEAFLQVLRETVDFLKETCGPAIDDWTWGKLHQLTFAHPLGSASPMDRLFNRGPFPLGGDFDTVWATGTSTADPQNKSIVGPPFRFIADLSDWNRCLAVLVPGQSGHPASPHYTDAIPAWFHGEYRPMLFDREAVEREAEARLVLQPDAPQGAM